MEVCFCQGFFLRAPSAISKAVATDYFKKSELISAMTVLAIAWGMGPIIAPFIGGYLEYFFNWQANFIFLTLYALMLLFLVLFFLPETNHHRIPYQLKQLLRNYQTICTHSMFIEYVLLIMLGYAMVILFNAISPFLIQVVLGKSVLYFGYLALIMGCAMFFGSNTNRYLIRRFNSITIIYVSLGLNLCSATVMLIIASLGIINVWVICIPSFIIFYFFGIVYPNVLSGAMQLFPKMAGSASAATIMLSMLGVGLIVALASHLHISSQLPLAVIYCVISMLLLLSMRFLIQKRI